MKVSDLGSVNWDLNDYQDELNEFLPKVEQRKIDEIAEMILNAISGINVVKNYFKIEYMEAAERIATENGKFESAKTVYHQVSNKEKMLMAKVIDKVEQSSKEKKVHIVATSMLFGLEPIHKLYNNTIDPQSQAPELTETQKMQLQLELLRQKLAEYIRNENNLSESSQHDAAKIRQIVEKLEAELADRKD